MRSSQPHAPDVVFETERGRVTHCACCGALEVRFGNALLALRPDELTDVLASVAASDTPAAPHADVPGRSTVLYLGNTGCGWTFDADETAELHRLLAGAQLLFRGATA